VVYSCAQCHLVEHSRWCAFRCLIVFLIDFYLGIDVAGMQKIMIAGNFTYSFLRHPEAHDRVASRYFLESLHAALTVDSRNRKNPRAPSHYSVSCRRRHRGYWITPWRATLTHQPKKHSNCKKSPKHRFPDQKRRLSHATSN